jgi:colanic acid/amylovoran biosynthesis protein
MKVLIMRASNTKNYGSLMMVANYIRLYKERHPTSSFIVDNVEVDGLQRIKDSSGVNDINSFLYLGIELRPDCNGNGSFVKLIKYFKYSLGFGSLMKSIGVEKVIQLGGDDFSEYYSIKALSIELIKIESLLKNKVDISLIGQTMGPFSSWRKLWVRRLLKKVTIFSRDQNSAEYLINDLSLSHVQVAADLAYLPLYKQDSNEVKNKVDAIIERFEGFIVIVPSGLWKAYTSNLENYVDSYVELINSLIKRNEKIIILSHVLSDTSSDNFIIKKIQQKAGVIDNVKYITDTLLPVEAREIISRSKVVISGRMHACVSALQVGVPAIPLSYSVKFKGVIGELELDSYMIDSVGDEIWNISSDNPIVGIIMQKFNDVSAARTTSNTIKSEVKRLESKIMKQF